MIRFRPIPWSQTAAAVLRKIPNMDQADLLTWEKRIVLNLWQLVALERGSDCLGYIVCRRDGDCLELGPTASCDGTEREDLARQAIPWIEEAARAAGCNALRVYPCRKGLVKRFADQGFDLVEYVMEKALKDGQ